MRSSDTGTFKIDAHQNCFTRRWVADSYSLKLHGLVSREEFSYLVTRVNEVYEKHRPEQYYMRILLISSISTMFFCCGLTMTLVGFVDGGGNEYDGSNHRKYQDTRSLPVGIAGIVFCVFTVLSILSVAYMIIQSRAIQPKLKADRSVILNEFNTALESRKVAAVIKQEVGNDIFLIEWADRSLLSPYSPVQYAQVADTAALLAPLPTTGYGSVKTV